MFFQPSPLSRPRQAVDAPRIPNLSERNYEQAARRARSSRNFNTQLARDHAYLHSIPYLESQAQDDPALAIQAIIDDKTDSSGMPEESFYEGEDVSSWAEDILLRCPTKVCNGRLVEVQNGHHFAYVCSETLCPVRVVGVAQKWDLYRLCESLCALYSLHQFCGLTPAAFLSLSGRATVKCDCGFEQEAQ